MRREAECRMHRESSLVFIPEREIGSYGTS